MWQFLEVLWEVLQAKRSARGVLPRVLSVQYMLVPPKTMSTFTLQHSKLYSVARKVRCSITLALYSIVLYAFVKCLIVYQYRSG